jgi:hypothetical protein
MISAFCRDAGGRLSGHCGGFLAAFWRLFGGILAAHQAAALRPTSGMVYPRVDEGQRRYDVFSIYKYTGRTYHGAVINQSSAK